MSFESTHKLDFEVAPWITKDFQRFRVGTCEGLYGRKGKDLAILAISNREPNNGHLNDVFEWFEDSCKKAKCNLWVLEIWNENFRKHLIDKRGFFLIGLDAFKKIARLV